MNFDKDGTSGEQKRPEFGRPACPIAREDILDSYQQICGFNKIQGEGGVPVLISVRTSTAVDGHVDLLLEPNDQNVNSAEQLRAYTVSIIFAPVSTDEAIISERILSAGDYTQASGSFRRRTNVSTSTMASSMDNGRPETSDSNNSTRSEMLLNQKLREISLYGLHIQKVDIFKDQPSSHSTPTKKITTTAKKGGKFSLGPPTGSPANVTGEASVSKDISEETRIVSVTKNRATIKENNVLCFSTAVKKEFRKDKASLDPVIRLRLKLLGQAWECTYKVFFDVAYKPYGGGGISHFYTHKILRQAWKYYGGLHTSKNISWRYRDSWFESSEVIFPDCTTKG